MVRARFVAVGGAFLLAAGLSTQALAQGSETDTYTLSVEVRNAFSLGSSGLAFGTITALASPTDQATLTINGQTGAVTATDGSSGFAKIIVISDGTPGEVDVTGAPPNTTLSVSITSGTTTLNPQNGGGGGHVHGHVQRRRRGLHQLDRRQP